MRNYISFSTNSNILFAVFAFLTLASCGSYQYVGTPSDGIYEEESTTVQVIEEESIDNTDTSSNYYSNYFKERSLEIDDTQDAEEVFTDVESYQSTTSNQANQNGGWGENSSEVNVHVYNNGWNNWGWNNWGYGYGWNNWGWYRPYSVWGIGWNNWGWNSGFYGAWGHPAYGYGFYGNPYYANFYNGYYGNGYRGYAYGNTRRTNNASYLGRNSAINSRGISSTLYRRNSNTRGNSPRVSTTPRTRNNTVRPRTGSSTSEPRSVRPRTTNPRSQPKTVRPRTNTPRTSTPRTSTPRTSTPRSSTPRSYSTPRSSTPRSYSAPRSSGRSSSSSRRPR